MTATHEQISPVASHVIAKCGGVKRVAELTGRAPSSIYKWGYPKSQGGSGGLIPADAQDALWRAVQRGDVDLTAEDFMRPEGAA